MNSMTLPRWFGRRRKNGENKSNRGPMLAKLDPSNLSVSTPNVKQDSPSVKKVFNKGWLSPKRASKSTCDIPTSSATPTRPLATSESTDWSQKLEDHFEKGSQYFNPLVGTPIIQNPTHDDILNAKKNLRKSLSANTLTNSGNIYENISPIPSEPNYQNLPNIRHSFTSANVNYENDVSRRYGSGGQLSILDEAEDEPASMERLNMLRASKRLFASQRDILIRQTNSPTSSGSFNFINQIETSFVKGILCI